IRPMKMLMDIDKNGDCASGPMEWERTNPTLHGFDATRGAEPTEMDDLSGRFALLTL
ncbi:hypothetical protein E8E11_000337, partial [Didymella keratinophila]